MPATRAIEQPYGQAYGGNAAENYERFFVPAIGEPFAREMIEAAALRPGERVLDVACGTGIVTRLAAERVAPDGTVAGLDVNPAMLAVARTLVPASRTPVRWYETTAEAMPLPDASFDVVLCQLGLMFMADKGAALREMRRVLAPGGRALISIPAPTAFFNALDEAIARHIGEDAAGFVRLVFSLHEPAEVEQLLNEAGFHQVRVRSGAKALHLPPPREFLWQYVRSTPLMGIMAEAGDDVRAALERETVSRWEPWTRGEGLAYEQPFILASGRKEAR